jgi:hypothetical protein
MYRHRTPRLLSILALLVLILVPLHGAPHAALASASCASSDASAYSTVVENSSVCSLVDASTQFAATGMPDNSSGAVTVTDFYPFSNGLDLTFDLPVASVVMLTFNGELACRDTSQIGMVGLFVDDSNLATGLSTPASPLVSASVGWADDYSIPAARVSLQVPVALGPGPHTVTLGAANYAGQNCTEVDADVVSNPWPPLFPPPPPTFGSGVSLSATIYPTAGGTFAKLIAFHVQRQNGTVTFSWRLADTRGLIGFNVYAGGQRLNRHTVAPHAAPTYTRHFASRAKSGYALYILGRNGSVTVVVPA